MAISTEPLTIAAAPPVPAVEARHRSRRPRRLLHVLRRPGLGILMAVATASLISWRLGRPAMWLDEAASATAVQRTWPNLWRLLDGADAPLVPYYAVLKALADTTVAVFPGALQHPDLLYRVPSMLALVFAGWGLVAWLARFCPAPMVVGTGAAFLLTAGVSRYGQEVRPYAMVVLATVACTVCWSWIISRRRHGWVPLYSACVALVILANPLAGIVVTAHFVTALSLEKGDRLVPALRTVVGAAIGVLAVLPLAITMMSNGQGATRFPPTTYDSLLHAFVSLFTYDPTPTFGIGYLLLLGLLGATRVFSRQYRFIARLAVAWAALPPLLLLPAVLTRPNLLIARYLMFTVPAWAILGGLGFATIVGGVRWLMRAGLNRADGWWPGWSMRRIPSRAVSEGESWRRSRARRRLGSAVAVVVAGSVLGGITYAQLPSLKAVRTADAHGADPRYALRVASLPQYRDLPIIPSTRYLSIQIAAYGIPFGNRLLGVHPQRTMTMIWTLQDPPGVRRELYRRTTEAVVIMRPDPKVPNCETEQILIPQVFAEQCMPEVLKQLDYQVLYYHSNGHGYGIAIVKRPSPLRGKKVKMFHAMETPGPAKND